MKRICFYLSDHGFGHIARNLPVIVSAVRRSNTIVYIVCGKRHIAFARQNLLTMLSKEEYSSIVFRELCTDVGLVVKEGTLLVDTQKLTAVCERYLSEISQKSRQEAEWLRENHIDAVLCDMPIWSIEACEKADIPLLYAGNFTWVELYREFLPEKIWQRYAEYYSKIRYAMLYALHNKEMTEFLPNAEIEEVSVTARAFHDDFIAEVKSRHTRKIIFVASGMSAKLKQSVDVSRFPYDFYTTEGVPLTGDNVTVLPYTTGNTQDYIAVADYVITKAGWTTVAECLLAHKPMALFRRDGVLEDRTTIQLLENRHLAISVQPDDLEHMEKIIADMDTLCRDYHEFYDCAEEIAVKLDSL